MGDAKVEKTLSLWGEYKLLIKIHSARKIELFVCGPGGTTTPLALSRT
jgi:hypothetical protein